MEHLTQQALAKFIRETVAEWMRDFESLDELVKQGYCADLATVTWEHFGRSDALIFHDSDKPCHTWLEFEGRHYDMQSPDGAESPEQMEHFRQYRKAISLAEAA